MLNVWNFYAFKYLFTSKSTLKVGEERLGGGKDGKDLKSLHTFQNDETDEVSQ